MSIKHSYITVSCAFFNVTVMSCFKHTVTVYVCLLQCSCDRVPITVSVYVSITASIKVSVYYIASVYTCPLQCQNVSVTVLVSTHVYYSVSVFNICMYLLQCRCVT